MAEHGGLQMSFASKIHQMVKYASNLPGFFAAAWRRLGKLVEALREQRPINNGRLFWKIDIDCGREQLVDYVAVHGVKG